MYKIAKGINIKKIGMQYIVKNENTNENHIINELAGEILDSIKRNIAIENIKLNIQNRFPDYDSKLIENDIDEIIEEYLRMSLIERCI